jgi:hypothetical protein
MSLSMPARHFVVATAAVGLLLAGGGVAAAGAHAHPKVRVSGTVTAGPACPVERVDQPCPPRPVNGATVELLRSNGKVTASTHTDASGKFRLAAAPGHYVLRAINAGGYRSEATKSVTLRAGKPKTVNLTVDSGIR